MRRGSPSTMIVANRSAQPPNNPPWSIIGRAIVRSLPTGSRRRKRTTGSARLAGPKKPAIPAAEGCFVKPNRFLAGASPPQGERGARGVPRRSSGASL